MVKGSISADAGVTCDFYDVIKLVSPGEVILVSGNDSPILSSSV